jgi:glycerol-3-phosphate dehydrogenase subunit B
MYDLAIIGSGFAGLFAAKKAHESGLKTCVISDGLGATQHFSGAFDVIDPRWMEPGLVPADYPSLRLALDKFVLAHPQHLYAQLATQLDDFSESLIAEAKDFFSFYNIPVVSDDNHLVAAISPIGKLKPTAFASHSQGLPNHILENASALYVHIPGLTHYPQEMIGQNLKAHFKQVKVVTYEVKHNATSAFASVLSFFEDSQAVAALSAFIKSHLTTEQVVVLPPVLGVENAEKNHQSLLGELKVKVIEQLSALPSSTGMRLQKNMQKKLNEVAEVVSGKVTGFTTDTGIQSLKVDMRGEENEVVAKNYLLATGKYLGGGLKHQQHFSESVFDLPVFNGADAVSKDRPMTHLLDPVASNSQPFMALGLKVDATGHPVCTNQKQVYTNLAACGHVLTGFDFTRDRCGFGVSIGSGMLAVKSGVLS